MQSEVNYPTNQHANIRDRIRKDMLIATSAKMYGSDIIFTNDSGFKVVCDKLNIFCHLLTENESQFVMSVNGDFIYDFSI
jgi:hypothetical protein